MRIALLTTDGLPALYCAQALSAEYELCGILTATSRPPLPFETAHLLDVETETFEASAWFPEKIPNLSDFGPVFPVPDMTSAAALGTVRDRAPNVIVAFNAGRLSAGIIELAKDHAVVLHAGNPEDFRGADTHLWAVYHGLTEDLQSIVQYADANPNTGAVLRALPVHLPDGTPLAGLRKAVTEGCVAGLLKVMRFFADGGMLTVNHLQRMGKLYTPMPAGVKDYCIAQYAARASQAK